MSRLVIKHVGRCIYCGAEGVMLTDEHIMPYALGANAVLEDASCIACQKATSRVELHVCRPVTGMMRSRLGIQTRNPSKRGSFNQTFRFGEEERTIPFETDAFPAVLSYPIFDPPGILTGRAPEGRYRSGAIYSLGADPDFKGIADAAIASAGASGVQLASFRPTVMMNFAAKVAQASAVALLPADSYAPLLTKAATSEDCFDYLLGHGRSFPPQEETLHAIELFQDSGPNGPLLIARLRWFSNLSPPLSELEKGQPIVAPPTFLAVVGRPHGTVLADNQRAYINWNVDGSTKYGTIELPKNWRSQARPVPTKN